VIKRFTIQKGSSLHKIASAVLWLSLCIQVGNTTALAATIIGASAPNPANSNLELFHVLVGHSFFIKTGPRLKRVYISNPSVLTSLTSTPYEVLVTAKAPGVSSLVVWDASGNSTVYTVSADIDTRSLQQALDAVLPKQHIAVSALQDSIGLSGSVATQADADTALKLAQNYTKDIANSLKVVPPRVKQVELKVRFIEVDRVKLAQFGVNFLSAGNNIASTSTQQFGLTTAATAAGTQATISNPLNLLLYNQSLNVGVAIQDLEQKQVIQILAEPTITAISGEKASFLSGGEFPFPVVQGGSGSYASVTVQFRPYGVKLDFTPTVNEDGTIRLKVAPEVSALDYTNEVEISGYTIPALSTRRAETDVELQSGQSFAISGLLDHRLTDQFSKMPGIASIPILGNLFRSKNVNRSVVELLVVVTPTVVDPLSAPSVITEPKNALPYIEPEQFDQELNQSKKKH
jgi:pilus assembly protein CpaC